jgi:hypothetical protein
MALNAVERCEWAGRRAQKYFAGQNWGEIADEEIADEEIADEEVQFRVYSV